MKKPTSQTVRGPKRAASSTQDAKVTELELDVEKLAKRPDAATPQWIDGTQFMVLSDGRIGMAIFTAVIPDKAESQVVARFMTTMEHWERISKVISASSERIAAIKKNQAATKVKNSNK